LIIAAVAALAFVLGCERKPARAPATQPAPPPRATYALPPELEQKYPEPARFVRQALETVVTGDYPAYRRLLAAARTPESEERFALIQRALRAIDVVSLEPLTNPNVPQPAYRAVAAFEFDPASRAATKLESRRLAILIFQENGAWRLDFAVGALRAEAAGTTSAPTTTQADNLPDYSSWRDNADY
jgi:hypothetical protein